MPVSSSVMRKRTAVPASKPKKLGATKLSELDAKLDPNSCGAPDLTSFEPVTPSPMMTSKRPTAASPTSRDRVQAPDAVILPKRDARHLAPPKTMNMAEWDDWSVSSAMDGVLGGFGSVARDRRDRGADDPGRESAAGPAALPRASLESFAAATGAEAVRLVGRAALASVHVMVDGIEGTADFVHRAARRADRMAHRALSPTGAAAAVSVRARADSGDEWGWAARFPASDVAQSDPSVAQSDPSVAEARHRLELNAARSENSVLREDLSALRTRLAKSEEALENVEKRNLEAREQLARDASRERRDARERSDPSAADPLNEQVRRQLEFLVAEKAKLARENDELWRENERLQELLMHSDAAEEAESSREPDGVPAEERAALSEEPDRETETAKNDDGFEARAFLVQTAAPAAAEPATGAVAGVPEEKRAAEPKREGKENVQDGGSRLGDGVVGVGPNGRGKKGKKKGGTARGKK